MSGALTFVFGMGSFAVVPPSLRTGYSALVPASHGLV